MAFDNLVFNQIVNLIKEPLINGKISKIQQISQEEFLFMIRSKFNIKKFFLKMADANAISFGEELKKA